jgi:hypothetical protein
MTDVRLSLRQMDGIQNVEIIAGRHLYKKIGRMDERIVTNQMIYLLYQLGQWLDGLSDRGRYLLRRRRR